jgi:hypothetical protein
VLRAAFALILLALAGCAGLPGTNLPQPREQADFDLPPMKTFAGSSQPPVTRSNESIARDFMDLAFELESGRRLPVLSRFEDPITVRVVGAAPPTLAADLRRLLARLRAEAGIQISQVPASMEAGITIEVVSRRTLQRAVPQAACFVAPRVSNWSDFVRTRRQPSSDWATLQTRDQMAIFLPGDVSPQEVRDCLHEELAQALGPVNDLYRLTDSVFNDDNFHAILTSFDMLILRTFYAPDLNSGMTAEQVASRLPAILNRINPAGRHSATPLAGPTPEAWRSAINTALSGEVSGSRRLSAAKQAVDIARSRGWSENRMAFSLFVLGRASLGTDGSLALSAFLQSAEIYGSRPDTAIQAAHVAVQLAAFALSSGEPEAATDLVNRHIGAAMTGENAGLLATLLMIKSEALEAHGKPDEARIIRLDSLGWARYGFGSDQDVRRRLAEITALAPSRQGDQPS